MGGILKAIINGAARATDRFPTVDDVPFRDSELYRDPMELKSEGSSYELYRVTYRRTGSARLSEEVSETGVYTREVWAASPSNAWLEVAIGVSKMQEIIYHCIAIEEVTP